MFSVIKDFESEAELLAYYDTVKSWETVIAVVFKDVIPGVIPNKLNYEIRMYSQYTHFDTNSLFTFYSMYFPGSGK